MYTTSACIITQIFPNVNTQNTVELLYKLYKLLYSAYKIYQLLKNRQSRLTCEKTDYIIFTVIKMLIKGFQKLTLLDFPGRTACTVFTAGCNFRCPFCHNALLVTEQDDAYYDESEIFEHLKRRKNVLDGVAVTGGEPLLQKDIERFLYEIKDMGYAVKLDTNGSFPEKLEGILELGIVDYVAMDIKNCPEKYGITAGVKNFDISPVEKSMELLKNSGIDYEFRTTVTKNFHTADDIEKIAQWIEGIPRYFLQNFENTGNLIDENCCGVSRDEMREMLSRAKKFVPNAELRGL